MPYAIIRTGGHQEKVTPGEQITVDRLKQEVGDEITWVPLVVSKDDGTVVSDKSELQAGAKVTGKVLEHIKGDKVDIFMYRNKTGSRRHTGHRQPLTLVEIASITVGDETFNAPEPAPAPDPAAQAEEHRAQARAKAEKKAEKKAAKPGGKGAAKPEAKKSAAKKPGPKPEAKKTTAKKTTAKKSTTE